MLSPAVSVLLPARDAERFLLEALASIGAQTFGDFEVVAVDDGSTDGTRGLLEAEARRDGRVRIVEGPGRGIAAALNAGLSACRAPLVARMDADDVALPHRLERQIAALAARPELAAVGCQVEIFPRQTLASGLRAYEAWLNSLSTPEELRRDSLVESPVVHPAAVVRREALEEAGGWRSEGWPEDWGLWLELMWRGRLIANVPEVLLRWRDRPDRLTRTHPDYAPSSLMRLRARYLARGLLAGGRCLVWGAGRTGRALSRALAAERVRVEGFVDIDSRKIGRRVYGAPVAALEALGVYEGRPLVVAVGAKGARSLIRAELTRRGWKEVEEFVCVG